MLSTTEDNNDNSDNVESSNDAPPPSANGMDDNSNNTETAVLTLAQSRRLYCSPHPDVGISSSSCGSNKHNKKPSKLQSLISAKSKVDENQQHKKKKHIRFLPSEARARYFTTTSMKHSNCGGHNQAIVAKDIHHSTNTHFSCTII